MPTQASAGLQPVKAVVFDMDGTLYQHADLNRAYHHSIQQMVAHVYQLPLPQAKELFETTFMQIQTRLRREPSKLYVLHKLGISDQVWAQRFGRQIAPYKWLKPDSELRHRLLTVRDRVKTAVVTNNHRHNTEATLKCLNILDCFDAIQTLSETRCFKPSTKLYRRICKTLCVAPDEVLSVGDRYDLDLAPAAAIGMQTLLVRKKNDLLRLSKQLTAKPAKRIKLTRTNRQTVVEQTSLVLKQGKLVVFPTDTVYGLASRVSQGSINWLYRAKGRHETNPIVLLIDDPKTAKRFVQVSPLAQRLMQAYWPGALTLVLPTKAGTKWGTVTRGGKMIGLRLPDHEWCCSLIKQSGGALATTSANPSGQPAPEQAGQIDQQILGFAELLIDDNKRHSGVSSTVAMVVANSIKILRQGEVDLSPFQRTSG